MAGLLNEDIKEQIREVFGQLKEPVQVLYFGRAEDCEYCEDTRHLVEEVTGLSDQLTLVVYDLDKDTHLASQYRIDKAPGLVIAGREGDQIIDYGIRIAGIPAGHEFTSFIHDLILVSGRDSGLAENTRLSLGKLEKPIHLQVFVTPT
jgi:alkyl hydroperoxide reductase subunit AhpF